MLLQRQAAGGTGGKDFCRTPRETQVTAFIVAGASDKEIVRKLDVSEQTVKNHVANIFGKLGVSDRLELVLFALHHRLIDRGQAAHRTPPKGKSRVMPLKTLPLWPEELASR